MHSLNIIGSFCEFAGTSVHARKFSEALSSYLKIHIFPVKNSSKLKYSSPKLEALTTKSNTIPGNKWSLYILSPAYFQQNNKFPQKAIAWVVFESTVISESMQETLKKIPHIWIPSHWGQKILIKNSISPQKIKVIPEGYDPKVYFPQKIQKPEIFTFLTVGKLETRKSYKELFTAFRQAFSAKEPVQLLVAGLQEARPDLIPKKLAALGIQDIDPRIQFLNKIPTEMEMNLLYNSVHAFILPTKAEGWGLPILEALGCGIPVITTNYSAPTEFLPTELTYLINPKKLEPIYCPFYYPDQTKNYGLWAKLDTNTISEAMESVYKKYDNALLKAQKAQVYVKEKWTWDHSAKKALKALNYQFNEVDNKPDSV